MSLEIFDGELSAASWAEAHGDALTEAALSGGARNWSWHTHSWGVIFEIEFDLVRHRLELRSDDGVERGFTLEPMSVAR